MNDVKADHITLAAVGDIAPNREDPPSIFRYCGDVFRTADIVFGQMEHPMTDKGYPTVRGARVLSPKNVTALTEKGADFDVMSVALNHGMHHGWIGFLDFLDILKKNNIAIVGGGKNIDEARTPVVLERKGTRVGFLAYLSIIPNSLLPAGKDVPGIAPLRASHYYQQMDAQPGMPPLVVTKLFPDDKQAMLDDINKLRPNVDILVVSQHCGVHHIPEVIAMYQKEAAYAAIDAGADLVLQHHAHILKGIEMYKGKVIFYGLGTFAAEHWLEASGKPRNQSKERWENPELHQLYHYKPKPGYEKWVFPFDGLKTMIAKAYIKEKKIQKVTFIPAYITPNMEPEVLTRKDAKAQEVFDYVVKISENQELAASFSWEGNEVLIGKEKIA